MSDYTQTLNSHVNKHRENGIFLDTNVLLLFIFALHQPSKIGFKRLEKYNREDGQLLVNFVSEFKRILTTPHVLAETSNLARQISKGEDGKKLASFLYPLFFNIAENSFVELNTIEISVDEKIFGKLGLTDSCIATLAKNRQLLLTDDLDLFLAALANNGHAINFTHMRVAAATI
ncbi:MAG: hypothetical protein H7Z70_08430 [Bacteroidia bacterium]|nr:hypothetical protein [Methylotenera sp.]